MANPEITYTIGDFIDAGKTVGISYANLSFIDKLDDIEFPIFNVLEDYIVDLRRQAMTVQLSENDFQTYMYKPRLLSSFLYGSTELYFVIMALNNICNVKEFTMRKIKLLKKEDMANFINSIYNSEKANLDIYNSKNK